MAAHSSGKRHRVLTQSARTAGPSGARVVESFGPVGDLELHRLDAPANFTCATCGRREHSQFAAAVKASWDLTVCEDCYLTLSRRWFNSHTASKKRKRPKNRLAAQAPASRGIPAASTASLVPQQRTTKSDLANKTPIKNPSVSGPSRAGIRRMLHFFWAAGVVTQTTANGLVYVSGELAGRISDFPPPETDAWCRAVDRIAWRCANDVLVRALANNAHYIGRAEAFPLPQENGFAVIRGRERIAVIHATHGSAPGRPPVYGNFLASGPHWEKIAPFSDDATDVTGLVNTLPTLSAQQSATLPRAVEWRRFARLPHDFDPVRAEACIAASQRIRLERQLDYPCPIILESRELTVILEPISGPDNSRHVPFRVLTRGRSVDGKFLLRGYGPDPLPLRVSADVPSTLR